MTALLNIESYIELNPMDFNSEQYQIIFTETSGSSNEVTIIIHTVTTPTLIRLSKAGMGLKSLSGQPLQV